MERISAKAVFIKETRMYKRYEISGDCIGSIYVPKKINAQVVEVVFDSGTGEVTDGK